MSRARPRSAPRRARRSHAERTAETRARILAAVVDGIAEVGFQQTTAAEITRRAGVTWGAVQHQFGGKGGILIAVLEDAFTRFAARLAEVPVEGLSLERRVERFVERALEHFTSREHASAFEILLDHLRRRGSFAKSGASWQVAMLRAWNREWQRFFPSKMPTRRRALLQHYTIAVISGLATMRTLAAARRASAVPSWRCSVPRWSGSCGADSAAWRGARRSAPLDRAQLVDAVTGRDDVPSSVLISPSSVNVALPLASASALMAAMVGTKRPRPRSSQTLAGSTTMSTAIRSPRTPRGPADARLRSEQCRQAPPVGLCAERERQVGVGASELPDACPSCVASVMARRHARTRRMRVCRARSATFAFKLDGFPAVRRRSGRHSAPRRVGCSDSAGERSHAGKHHPRPPPARACQPRSAERARHVRSAVIHRHTAEPRRTRSTSVERSGRAANDRQRGVAASPSHPRASRLKSFSSATRVVAIHGDAARHRARRSSISSRALDSCPRSTWRSRSRTSSAMSAAARSAPRLPRSLPQPDDAAPRRDRDKYSRPRAGRGAMPLLDGVFGSMPVLVAPIARQVAMEELHRAIRRPDRGRFPSRAT